MGAQKITNAGFLSAFMRRHGRLRDRPFCWVLGSGASFQSGIPTGGALVDKWLNEMHEMEDFDKQPLEKWATAENLGISGFDFKNAAASYPFIYERCYKDDKKLGFAELEAEIAGKEPSFGYSILAQIMAHTKHKVAITTNFDNLIADALSIYTREFPFVCGHESLAEYIAAHFTRPVVAKVHRDLLLSPQNRPDEINMLSDEWQTALTKILRLCTPIVIGYGGNDGGFMKFLENFRGIEGGIFWCYLEGQEVDERIQEVVLRHDGRLVPISGFDELMFEFGKRLLLPDPTQELQDRSSKRVDVWKQNFSKFDLLSKTVGEGMQKTSEEKSKT